MMLNPKIPVTRGGDSSIIGNARGVRLNTANSNTWTGAQYFSNIAQFNSSVYYYSSSYNYSTFYNLGTMYNNGGFYSTVTFVSTGTMTATTFEASTYIKTTGGVLPYTDYPYTYTYYLSHAPVTPHSLNGSSSYGGVIYDDGYGNVYDNMYGMIATIDYTLGLVTDTTGFMVSTNSIAYTAAATGYCELLPTGDATFTGKIKDSTTVDSISSETRALYNASGTMVAEWSGNFNILGTLTGNYGNWQIDPYGNFTGTASVAYQAGYSYGTSLGSFFGSLDANDIAISNAQNYEFSSTMQAALTSGYWSSAVPTSLVEALNRIAAVVSSGGMSPIP